MYYKFIVHVEVSMHSDKVDDINRSIKHSSEYVDDINRSITLYMLVNS